MVRSRGRAVLRRGVIGGACLTFVGGKPCMGRINKTRGKSCGKDADAARGQADGQAGTDAEQDGKNAKIWSVATFT